MGKCLGDDTEGQPQEQQKNLEIKQEQIKEQKLRILLPRDKYPLGLGNLPCSLVPCFLFFNP